jgi:hypothetical protein
MAHFSPESIDEIMAQESALLMAQMIVNFPFTKSQDHSYHRLSIYMYV